MATGPLTHGIATGYTSRLVTTSDHHDDERFAADEETRGCSHLLVKKVRLGMCHSPIGRSPSYENA